MADKRDLIIKRRSRPVQAMQVPSEEKRSSSSTEQLPPAKRRKRRKKNILRLIFRMVAMVSALALLVIMIYNWKDLAPEAVVEWIETVFTGKGQGEGFPLPIEGDTVVDMIQVKRQTALLTDSSLTFLSDTAGSFRSCNCSFSDPAMSTADKYVLLLERGGKRYQLETRFETVSSGSFSEGTILAGCVDTDGTFAVALRSASQDYLSAVLLFDKNGNKLFSWQSPKWMVTDIALQNERLVITGIAASGGALTSALILFDYKNDPNNPIRQQRSDTLFSRVFLLPDGTAAVISEQAYYTYDAKGNLIGLFDFGGLEWTAAEQSDGLIGLILSSNGVLDGGYLVVIGASAVPSLYTSFSDAFRNLSAREDGFWLLTAQTVSSVTSTALQSELSVAADSRLVCDFNGAPLILGLSALYYYEEVER